MSRRCPCCGSSLSLKRYCERLDVDGNPTNLLVCAECTALVDVTRLDAQIHKVEANLEIDRKSPGEIIGIDGFLKNKDANVDAIASTIQFMFKNAAGPIGLRRAVTLEAGFGHMAAAACKFFDESWALEADRWILDQVVPHYGGGERLQVGSSIDDVPGKADAIFLWHTLDHTPAAYEIGRTVAQKLEARGVLFWQVPVYSDEYIVSSRFNYFNAHAATVFNDRIGLNTEGVWFDQRLRFMTVLSRKPS